MIVWTAKDPAEVADYTWSPDLDAGDTIATFTASLPVANIDSRSPIGRSLKDTAAAIANYALAVPQMVKVLLARHVADNTFRQMLVDFPPARVVIRCDPDLSTGQPIACRL